MRRTAAHPPNRVIAAVAFHPNRMRTAELAAPTISSMRVEPHTKEQSRVVEAVGLVLLVSLLFWPRLVLFGFAIVDSHLIRDAFDSWLVAIAGFFLLPWTALAYASMWAISSDRVTGWEWAAVAVAFLLDVWAWSAFFQR